MRTLVALCAAAAMSLAGPAFALNHVWVLSIDPATSIPTTTGDPAFISEAGYGYSASADLAAGVFKTYAAAVATDPNGAGNLSYAGLGNKGAGYEYFTLTNSGPPIPAASLFINVNGTYTFGPGTLATPLAQGFGQLIVTVGPTVYKAQENHLAQVAYDAMGNLVNSYSTLSGLVEQNGAHVDMFTASSAALNMNLVTPTFAWATGQAIIVQFQMASAVTAHFGSAISDFSHSAALHLVVPPGSVITNNAGIPLAWLTTTLAVGEDGTSGVAFAAPWPNPARDGVSVALDLERAGNVTVAAFDLAGRQVASVLDERLPAGRTVRTWMPERLATGVYLLRADVGGRTMTRRIVWLGSVAAAR